MKKNSLKKIKFSNALSHHCTDAWVTRPERPKGREGSYQAGPKGRSLEVGAQRAPRLLVLHIYATHFSHHQLSDRRVFV